MSEEEKIIKKQNLLLAILLVVLTLLLGVLFFITYDYYHEPQFISGEVETASENKCDKFLVPALPQACYNESYTENKVGWLWVSGTTVNDLLVQGKDNEFYLNHNEFDKKDARGAYYVLSDSNMKSPDALSKVTVVFGHSSGYSTNKKFSVLKKLKDAEFASRNQTIWMWVGEKPTKWQIFAAGDYPVVNDYLIAEPDKEYLQNEIQNMKNYSYCQYRDVDVSTDDKILILSTCNEESYKTRYIVCAKQIDF
ncbi:MAG: class B sortase [Ruthenibacterium sp.]